MINFAQSELFFSLLVAISALANPPRGVDSTTISLVNEINNRLNILADDADQPGVEKEVLNFAEEVFRHNGVKVSQDSYKQDGVIHKIFKIEPGKSSILNRVAEVKGRQLGLSFYFAPLQPRRGFVQAKYDIDSNSLIFAWDLDQILVLKSPLFFHELVHAVLSKAVYQDGRDMTVGSVVIKKEVSPLNMNDMMNPYVHFLSLQELTAYPYQHNLEWQAAKRMGTIEALVAAQVSISTNIMGHLIWSKEALRAANELLAETDLQITPEAGFAANPKSVQLKVSNDTYGMYFIFPSTLTSDQYVSAVKKRLEAIKSYTAEFVYTAKAVQDLETSTDYNVYEKALRAWNNVSLSRIMTSRSGPSCKKVLAVH